MKKLFLLFLPAFVWAATQGWQPSDLFDIPSLTTNACTYSGSNGQLSSVSLNTKTTPNLLSQTNSGAPAFTSNGIVAGVPVTNLKFVNGFATTASTGDLDIYTVPAGKRSLLSNVQMFNTNAGSITAFSEVKISGTYYGLAGSVAITTGTEASPGNDTIASPILLEAGQSFSVNTATNSGLNVWYQIQEFDNTAAIKSAMLLGYTTGQQTLYTVPSGKTARILSVQDVFDDLTSATVQGLFAYAGTSGSMTIAATYLVPSAGSPGTSNQATASVTITSAHSTRFGLQGALGSGDFISVNETAGNTNQIIWVNLVEL